MIHAMGMEDLIDDDSDDNDDLLGDDLEGQGSDIDEQPLTTLLKDLWRVMRTSYSRIGNTSGEAY